MLQRNRVPGLSLAEEDGGGGVGDGEDFINWLGIYLDGASAASAVEFGKEDSVVRAHHNVRVVAMPPCGVADWRGEPQNPRLGPFFLEGLVMVVFKPDHAQLLSLDKKDFLSGEIKVGVFYVAAERCKCLLSILIQKKIS